MDFKYIDSRRFEADGNLYERKYSFRRRWNKYTIFVYNTGKILFKDISEITIDGAEINDRSTLESVLGNILFRRSCECADDPSIIDDGIFDDTFDETFE